MSADTLASLQLTATIDQTLALHQELKQIVNKGNIAISERAVTQCHVCQSAAGFYIGQWCVENMGGDLVPMPYDRLSGYGTKEEMLAVLDEYRKHF